MTNKKVTRRALLMSVTSLLICISMLLGTTFAWFTDEVTSGVNQIVAGNLDVELEHNTMTDGAFAQNDSPVSTSEYLFKSEAGGDKMLWEPGAMAIEKLTVKNVGTLALKYKLNFSIKGYNKVNEKDLSDVIKAYVTNTAPATRSVDGLTAADLDAFSKEGTLTAGTAADPNTETFYVILYWAPNDNDVDNQYNLKNGLKADDGSDKLYIDLGVNLVAGQLQSEVDSFDNTYDENATYPVGINTLSKTVVSAAKATSGDTTLTSGLVTATVPTSKTGFTLSDGTNDITTDASTEFTLTVEPTTAAAATVAVTTGTDNADYYDISLAATTTTISGNSTSTETKNVKSSSEIITVTLNIGTGLTDVVVYHGNTPMGAAAGTTPAANTFAYDANTGILTLYVNSFSPFVIGYNNPVAAIGGVYYATLPEAVRAALRAEGNVTVTLLRDASGYGFSPDGDELGEYTIDFAGHTYNVTGLVGSTGTATQAWRVIEGQTATLKNGTLTSSNALMLINQYGMLTLDNMIVDGSKMPKYPYSDGTANYTLSNNSGKTVIKNGTIIKVVEKGHAFDVCGSYAGKSKNIEVVVEDAVINGIVEFDKGNGTNAALTINGGDFTNATFTGFEAGSKISITGGTFSSDPTDYVADGYMVNKENDLFTVISEADKAVELAKAAGATNVAKSGTGAIGTMSDNVIYYWYSDGTVYVYDATNYNGYYGEDTKDENTYYVGKLVDVKGLLAAFNGNSNITKLVITKDLDYTKKALGGNTTIKTIEFANGVTRVNDRLVYHSAVETVILPNSITTIEAHALREAYELKSITVPTSVTSIGTEAFAYCPKLETVTIQGSPTIDTHYLGRNCPNLKDVYFSGVNTQFAGDGNMVFTVEESGNASGITIHFVNDALKNEFSTHMSNMTGVNLVTISA